MGRKGHRSSHRLSRLGCAALLTAVACVLLPSCARQEGSDDFAIVAGRGRKVWLLDPNTLSRERVFSLDSGSVTAIDVSPTGDLLAVACVMFYLEPEGESVVGEAQVHLVSARGVELLWSRDARGIVEDVRFSPDGTMVAFTWVGTPDPDEWRAGEKSDEASSEETWVVAVKSGQCMLVHGGHIIGWSGKRELTVSADMREGGVPVRKNFVVSVETGASREVVGGATLIALFHPSGAVAVADELGQLVCTSRDGTVLWQAAPNIQGGRWKRVWLSRDRSFTAALLVAPWPRLLAPRGFEGLTPQRKWSRVPPRAMELHFFNRSGLHIKRIALDARLKVGGVVPPRAPVTKAFRPTNPGERWETAQPRERTGTETIRGRVIMKSVPRGEADDNEGAAVE